MVLPSPRGSVPFVRQSPLAGRSLTAVLLLLSSPAKAKRNIIGIECFLAPFYHAVHRDHELRIREDVAGGIGVVGRVQQPAEGLVAWSLIFPS